ncbi:hypothetical protein PENTCL1PPCAC_1954, partial [Pristionchus entomophagus]
HKHGLRIVAPQALVMTFLPLIFSIFFLPLVSSLQCYTFQTPASTDLTNVQKTTVDCPITSRFCVSSYQQVTNGAGNSMLMESRGCADDVICHSFVKSQCTGCLGSGYGKMCCCMGDHCNERME